MKRIVYEQFHVAELPADLRGGSDLDSYVLVTIELDGSEAASDPSDRQDDVDAAPDA